MPKRKMYEHKYRIGNLTYFTTAKKGQQKRLLSKLRKRGFKDIAPRDFREDRISPIQMVKKGKKTIASARVARLPREFIRHDLYHAIQTGLHHSAGIPLKGNGLLATIEQDLFDTLAKNHFAKDKAPVTFEMAREAAENSRTMAWTEILGRALESQYKTPQKLRLSVREMLQHKHLIPSLKRLNKASVYDWQIPKKRNELMKDIAIILQFFKGHSQ